MNFDYIKGAMKIFRANRRRTLLTMFGIVIGIAAVIIIMSVGAGARSLVVDQISSIGSNLIGVLPGYSDENGPPAAALGIAVTTLNAADAEALRQQIPLLTAVAAYVRGTATVQYGAATDDVSFIGTTAEYVDVEETQVVHGNFFTDEQTKGVTRVAVLGADVAATLFDNEDPIGKKIKIRRESFQVIGVFDTRGTSGFENQDALVFIPLETAQKLLLGINHINFIRAKVASEHEVPTALEEVKQVLRVRHRIDPDRPDDFTVRATTQALDVLGQVTRAIDLFLAGIAAISLIVGGVGIMNIMLVNVNERTREIGLRKAVGATARNIQRQFLTETLLVTLLGGVIGILIGAMVAGGIALAARGLGYQWEYHVSLFSIVLSVSVTCMVGIVFGWYPARKAARLEPIEALRYE